MPAAPEDGDESSDAGSEPKGSGDDDRAPGERADLPTWNRSRRKRKANVKAEQADDAFQRGVRKASRRVIDTPKLVLGGIVIAVALIAGGVALANTKLGANAEASRTLQAATSAFVRGQVIAQEEQDRLADQLKMVRTPIYATQEEQDAAVAEAIAAAKAVDSKVVAADASLLAASAAMQAGDFDAALSEYEAFLDSTGNDHPLRFLALEGKGNALEGKGDLEGALVAFQAIAPHTSDYYRPMALYHQGRVLEGLERKDEALAIYRQYMEEFPSEEMATPLVRERAKALDPTFASAPTMPAGLMPTP